MKNLLLLLMLTGLTFIAQEPIVTYQEYMEYVNSEGESIKKAINSVAVTDIESATIVFTFKERGKPGSSHYYNVLDVDEGSLHSETVTNYIFKCQKTEEGVVIGNATIEVSLSKDYDTAYKIKEFTKDNAYIATIYIFNL